MYNVIKIATTETIVGSTQDVTLLIASQSIVLSLIGTNLYPSSQKIKNTIKAKDSMAKNIHNSFGLSLVRTTT